MLGCASAAADFAFDVVQVADRGADSVEQQVSQGVRDEGPDKDDRRATGESRIANRESRYSLFASTTASSAFPISLDRARASWVAIVTSSREDWTPAELSLRRSRRMLRRTSTALSIC